MPRTISIRKPGRGAVAAAILAVCALLAGIFAQSSDPTTTDLGRTRLVAAVGVPDAWNQAYLSERPSVKLVDPNVGYTRRDVTLALPPGTSQTMVDRLNGFDYVLTAISPEPGRILDQGSVGSVDSTGHHPSVTFTVAATGYQATFKARARFWYSDTPTSTAIDVFSDWTAVPWPDGSDPGGTPIPPPTDTPTTTSTTTTSTTTSTSSPSGRVIKVDIAPHAQDDLILRRDINITSDGSKVARYEYAWAFDENATAPTSPVQRSTTGHRPQLYYGPTTPNTTAFLFVRAVTPGGTPEKWAPSISVKIPGFPRLFFGIDSYTSGHNQVGGKTICDDPNYGYAPIFAQKWLAALPPQWRTPGQVLNVAHSGFATQMRAGSKITGSALQGGINACGDLVKSAPIITVENALMLSVGSWNRWIATGSANDTNWVDIVTGAVTYNALYAQSHGREISATVCGNYIANSWDGTSRQVQASITAGVKEIADRLRTIDPSIQITWMGYPNIAGTGKNGSLGVLDLPASCEYAIGVALKKLHAAVRAGLPHDAQWIDSDPVLHMRGDMFQELPFRVVDPKNPPGWPHLNQRGAQVFAGLLKV